MMKKIPPLGNTKSAKISKFFFRRILSEGQEIKLSPLKRIARLEGMVIGLYRTIEQYGIYNKILYRKYKTYHDKYKKKRARKRVPR